MFRTIPRCFSVLAGEIVHNMRSALDYVACDLVEAFWGKRVRGGVSYPIATSEKDWLGRVEFPRDRYGKRVLGPLPRIDRRSDAWAYVKRTQPYQCGRRPEFHRLAGLAAMSNRDKHRLLNATTVYPGFDVFDMFGWSIHAHFVFGKALLEPDAPLKDGTPLALFQFDPDGPDPHMRVKRKLPFDIAFGEEEGEERAGSLTDTLGLIEKIARDCRIWTG